MVVTPKDQGRQVGLPDNSSQRAFIWLPTHAGHERILNWTQLRSRTLVSTKMLLPLGVFFAFGLTNLFHAQVSAEVTTENTTDVYAVVTTENTTDVSAVVTTENTTDTSLPELGLYYETLCPFCREFVIEKLLPTYLRAPDRIKLKLVPYGKADTYDTPEGYTFSCQHGPRECLGNKIHSCAIDIVEDQVSMVKMVECMIRNETDPEAIGEKCSEDLGINWEPILECSRGSRGNLLLKRHGDTTKALTPRLRGVPLVTLNGSQENKAAVRHDPWGEICKVLSDPKPEDCPQLDDTYDEE